MDKYKHLIDHTCLYPEANINTIKKLCEEAMRYQFAAVCVNPTWVSFSANMLKQSPVKVCAVIGFPLGVTTTESKCFEALEAIQNGADEIDVVINHSYIGTPSLENELNQLVHKVDGRATIKLILETSSLTKSLIKHVCLIAKKVGVDFVKTSTGFSDGGATVEDITLMRETIGDIMGVKASGGIQTYEDIKKMVNAGANRIGTSSAVDIIKGVDSKREY